MTISEKTLSILSANDIDKDRGFLPSYDPLQKLSTTFSAWDQFAEQLSSFINAGIIKDRIKELPLLSAEELIEKPECERAMLLLSFFAHAYINDPLGKEQTLPENISIPWINVANKLGRFPIISHASGVLHNWKKIDPEKPIQLDNLDTLMKFHGGIDEAWFYLVTVLIEKVGARAIIQLLECLTEIKEEHFDNIPERLQKVCTVIKEMHKALVRMYERCDPYIFYTRVRPFLSSFENVKYVGVIPEVRNYHGGSAAQSSLLQFLDAAFGIDYQNNNRTRDYLLLMRKHMPAKHASFLEYTQAQSQLKNAASKDKMIKEAYQEAVNNLVEFRNEHLKLVAKYIMKQAKDTGQPEVGTGGTNPMEFLKSIRDRNQEYKNL